MIKGIIFDFNRTVYDPDANALVDGVKTLLDELQKQKIKMALLCKKGGGDRAEIISSLGLEPYFCKILIVEGRKKPEHLQECLDAMGVAADESAVVGDRVVEEISAGNQIGMKTIWYKQGKFSSELPQTDAQKPAHTILNMADILEIVKQ